jgi:hypothetical protein
MFSSMGARNPASEPGKCLGFLAGKELYGKCLCGQERRFAIAPLARKFGKFTHFTYLGQFIRCQACGHKGIVLELVNWDEASPKDRIPY